VLLASFYLWQPTPISPICQWDPQKSPVLELSTAAQQTSNEHLQRCAACSFGARFKWLKFKWRCGSRASHLQQGHMLSACATALVASFLQLDTGTPRLGGVKTLGDCCQSCAPLAYAWSPPLPPSLSLFWLRCLLLPSLQPSQSLLSRLLLLSCSCSRRPSK